MIEFIAYDGQAPNLCSGILTVKINGVEHRFGLGAEHPSFWYSGGSVWFDNDSNEHISTGEWELNEKQLPKNLRKYGEDLINVFNANVPYGCCGGCL